MRSVQNISIVIIFLVAFACTKPSEPVNVQSQTLHDAMQNLSDVIVHDIFSPPVASRIYAYPSIAAYEILASNDSSYNTLAGQLNGLDPIPQPKEKVNYEVAALQAFQIISKTLIFSEQRVDEFTNKWHTELKENNMDSDLFDASMNYGEKVAEHILAWADKDNYKQTRTYEKFNVATGDPERWQPTPPAYMEAIEPHWSKIRPFIIDSANQFIPAEPTAFEVEEGTDFFKEMKEVYETGVNLTEEQAEIASFWDCNPYVMNVTGHVMFATKKITPGGHWIGIVKIACNKENASLMKSAEAYAMTSIALADGFIVCWDEKYRSNLIRPETVINKYLDEEWRPLLQTPPFPEYTSGHSVISTAAAKALTEVFGEPFHFVDSTEVRYGLPPREFDSFMEASQEAAMSRLYGGIHYMPAIDEGVKQGKKVGNYVVNNLTLRKEDALSLSN